MSVKICSALLAIAAYTNAISYDTHCDQSATPSNYDDCHAAMQMFGSAAGNDAGYVWEAPAPGSSYNCYSYTVNECIAEICWYNGQSFTQNYVVDGFDTIIQQCEPIPAGGVAYLRGESGMTAAVRQNRTPPSKAKRHWKRQNWENAYTVENAAPRQYWQQVQSATPGGSSWALTESDSQTNMVQFSVSVSEDIFELFKSEQSVTYGYSEEVTYSTTTTIQNTCSVGDEGFLYWTPLFTQYHGGYLNGEGPSPEDIYIPLKNSDGSARGEYIIQCGAQP